MYSLSSQTSWAGSTVPIGLECHAYNTQRRKWDKLIEIPLRTISNLGSADANVSFTVQEYNASGSVATNLTTVQWRIVYDFNDSLETILPALYLDVTTGANVT